MDVVGEGRRGWDGLGAALTCTPYHVYNEQLLGTCCTVQGPQLCADLDWGAAGWEGGLEGGDVCTRVAESHGCKAEANATL